MKKLTLLSIIILITGLAGYANKLDSLKQQLQITTDDNEKAALYIQMANCYLEPSNTNNPYTKRINQENAINYTMLAMKVYYRHDDTTGMVNSYSNLSRAYRAQKKYAQAKWFILQANTLSRRQKSVPLIINTLVDLASIKIDIKDYKLAKKDLKEAHRLAKANNFIGQDSVVKSTYSRLYTFIQVPPNENVFQGLDESIRKEELAYAERQKKLAASIKIKKNLAKKKMYAVNATRGESIKLNKPVVYWETPMNSTPTDSLRTASL